MGTATKGASGQAETTDPVCGEVFPPELAVFHSDRDGRRYHFCSKTCKETFDAAPDRYPEVSE